MLNQPVQDIIKLSKEEQPKTTLDLFLLLADEPERIMQTEQNLDETQPTPWTSQQKGSEEPDPFNKAEQIIMQLISDGYQYYETQLPPATTTAEAIEYLEILLYSPSPAMKYIALSAFGNLLDPRFEGNDIFNTMTLHQAETLSLLIFKHGLQVSNREFNGQDSWIGSLEMATAIALTQMTARLLTTMADQYYNGPLKSFSLAGFNQDRIDYFLRQLRINMSGNQNGLQIYAYTLSRVINTLPLLAERFLQEANLNALSPQLRASILEQSYSIEHLP